jgi:hypothetical protein
MAGWLQALSPLFVHTFNFPITGSTTNQCFTGIVNHDRFVPNLHAANPTDRPALAASFAGLDATKIW